MNAALLPTRLTLLGALLLILPMVVPACSGRLSGGGGGSGVPSAPPTVLPPLQEAAPLAAPTLISAVPDLDRLAVRWSAADSTVALALFVGPDPNTLFDGAPVADPLTGDSLIVSGLPSGGNLTAGLARVVSGGFEPTGALLTITMRAPVFVDVTANPVGANGLTPATAYPTIFPALLDGLIAGGANLWIAGGSYPPSALPVFPNVHLYGGFAADFALETRDPVAMPTILPGLAGQQVISIDGPGLVVLDGLVLDGLAMAKVGLQAINAPIELRGMTILNCLGPGLRLRGDLFAEAVPMVLVDCILLGNAAEGASIIGAVGLSARGCRFESNVQEGADFDDLTIDVFKDVAIAFSDCRFAGNGSEGLDLDMAVPLLGSAGGDFDVSIDNCVFEQNGASGLLLDVDYSAASGARAALTLRGVVARANGMHGVHLDPDATATLVVDSLVSTANGGDGLLVSSDVVPVVVTVAHSVLAANLGAGARTIEGQAGLVLSHVLVAGNGGGGARAESGAIGAVSSVAWLQPAPWVSVTTHHVVTADDPLQPALGRLPVFYTQITAWDESAPETLNLAAMPDGAAALEIDADGLSRLVTSTLGANSVTVDPAPLALIVPASLTAFPDGADVLEDYRALPGGAADGGGMAPLMAVAVDAGPLPSATDAVPGLLELSDTRPFSLATSAPALGATLMPGDGLTLTFAGGVLDPATVDSVSVVVRDGGGAVQSAVVAVLNDALVVSPAGVGWADGPLLIELHSLLVSLGGEPLSSPLMLPFEVSP